MEAVLQLISRFKKGMVIMENKCLEKIILNYKLYYISESNNLNDQDLEINMKKTNLFVIDQFNIQDTGNSYDHFIISFQKSLIIIKQTSLHLLGTLFGKNKMKSKISFCFLSNSKNNFDQNLSLTYQKIKANSYLNEEIFNFNKFLVLTLSKKEINIWNALKSSISAYFIMNGYLKTKNDRIKEFFSNKPKLSLNINRPNEFIELRIIGSGVSVVSLIYHIEKERLFALKKPSSGGNEIFKLINREINNYSEINHPFIPKYFGSYLHDNYKNQIIEFINGKTLLDIDKNKLIDNDKITILYEIMLVIQYLHSKKFIFRDLKPNNVIIDANNTVILIDFDRMIKNDDEFNNIAHTKGFNSVFMDPNTESNNFSYEVDIYSIGKMIFYLMNNKIPNDENCNQINNYGNYPKMKEFYEICTNFSKNERPTISELIDDFYMNFKSQILISTKTIESIEKLNENSSRKIPFEFGEILPNGQFIPDESSPHFLIPVKPQMDDATLQFMIANAFLSGNNGLQKNVNESIYQFTVSANSGNIGAQNKLGQIYYDGIEVPRDIKQSIHFYTMAANQNDSNALLNLGIIYYNNEYIQRDINKSIKYLKSASNLNNSIAQFYLGLIYSEGKFIQQDIKQSIFYYSLASNLNNGDAQYNLGNIYYKGQNVPPDIKKAIHLYELAAKNNSVMAQFTLGSIYLKGKDVPRDINKSIHLFTEAANKNYLDAQYNLGVIYFEGKYVKRDINKAIKYFTSSVDNNHIESQYMLGCIYYEGIHVKRNYDKAIHYFTLAANQNHVFSQYNLGIIYSVSDYKYHDSNLAIKYFTMAAENNFGRAQYILGSIYYENIMVLRDIKKSVYFLTFAAENGVFEAQYSLSVILIEGKYVPQDINKGLHYLSLSVNQDYIPAQILIGRIYYEGKLVKHDIQKSIYYLKKAADKDSAEAQKNLGLVFYEGIRIPKDLNKAVEYFTLAAKKKNPIAQCFLGIIYLQNKNDKNDLNKAIKYLTLSADQNYVHAQYILGTIYIENQIVPRNIEKSIHYLTLASNQNDPSSLFSLYQIYASGQFVRQDLTKAINYLKIGSNINDKNSQYALGMFYYVNGDNRRDILRGIDLLILSSNNNNYEADFVLGFIYHEGKNIKKDIQKAIKYYKEASSLNHQFSKNNLGIIYKNEFEGKYLESSIVFFEEAIRIKDDEVAMYNLAHLYLYNDYIKNKKYHPIELLIKSARKGFQPSIFLLCLALIKLIGFDLDKIKMEIDKNFENQNDFSLMICQIILEEYLNDQIIFQQKYQIYQNIDFLYNPLKIAIPSNNLKNIRPEQNIKDNDKKDITTDFYAGFGISLN